MTNKKRPKTKITLEIAEEMFLLFLQDKSFAEIARAYPKLKLKRQHVYGACERHNWRQRKENIAIKMASETDYELVKKIVQEKTKQVESMAFLMASVYEDIKEDYENRNNPHYNKKIEIKNMADLERLYKLFFLIQADGVPKSESKNINENTVVEMDDNLRKQLLEALAEGRAEKDGSMEKGLHLIKNAESKANEDK